MVQLENNQPRGDGSMIPKDIGPALEKMAKHWQETNATVKAFPDEFANKVVHPLYAGAGIGLILGLVLGLSFGKRKQ